MTFPPVESGAPTPSPAVDGSFTEPAPGWLRDTLDRLSEGLLVIAANRDPLASRITFVNDAFCRLTGYARQELLGNSPWMIHGPGTDLNEIERLRNTLFAGREYRGELQHYRRDGTSFLAEWVVTPTFSSSGEVTHFVALQRDITLQRRTAEALREANDHLERRVAERTSALADLALRLSTEVSQRARSEEALRLSEQRFRLLCEHSPVGVFLADASGACCYANPRLLAINGVDAEKMYGDGYIRQMHRDDREAVVRQWREDTDAGRESETSFRVVPPNDEPRWVLARSAAVRSSQGELLGYVGSVEDVTQQRRAASALAQAHAELEQRVSIRTRELSLANDWLAAEVRDRRQMELALRESEMRWRTLVEHAPVYILLVDPDGRISFLNRARPGMDREMLIGDDLYHRIPPDSLPLVQSQLQLSRETGEPVEFEASGYSNDGDLVWYHTRVAPLGRGDQCTGWLFVSTDITDRRRAEEQARERQAALAHVARVSVATELATGLAHEINQPLTAIASSAEAMLRFVRNGDALSQPNATRVIEQIADQAQRAAAVIRRLRGFVRKAPPTRTATNINVLIQDSIAFMRHEVQQSEVRIETDLAGNLPDVLMDAVQVQQVLVNLIKNACESARDLPADRRRIRIHTGWYDEDFAEITVSDQGAGIDPASIDQIFDTFYTTKSTGLGLGLAISRSLIEDHGGRLTVRVNDPYGVTFSCRLPTRGANYDGA